jgi:CheY-like chemotaxis protein/HD-like signal output (HDOD) protein
MAHILLLDESDVAARALRGILDHGNHRCTVATNADEARRHLTDTVTIDLVFAELKLSGENGVQFLQRLRSNSLFRPIPVVTYTVITQQEVVKKVLSLRVQNYLIKPYSDDAIHQEIARAEEQPWRDRHFEEIDACCARLGISPAELKERRETLRTMAEESALLFAEWADTGNRAAALARIDELTDRAENAGVPFLGEYLKTLHTGALAGHWEHFKHSPAELKFVSRLIEYQLRPPPAAAPEPSSEQAAVEGAESVERAKWFNVDVRAGGPVVSAADLEKQLETVTACPVMETVAAAFAMAADSKASSVTHLMDLVATDPGLSAQVLIAANRLKDDDISPLEDPRAAVGLLGDLRLIAMAAAMPTVADRHLHLPPFTWTQFWMFQVGVGRVAQFACQALELEHLAAKALTGGLLHDLGRLVLARLHPFAPAAIIQHARHESTSIAQAEHAFLGCTTHELGGLFASKLGLPSSYTHVIRWIDTPEQATHDRDLVAAVSLARHLCRQNHLGESGESIPPPASIADSSAWHVLSESVYPSFNLKTFETQVRAFCARLKKDLAGQLV